MLISDVQVQIQRHTGEPGKSGLDHCGPSGLVPDEPGHCMQEVLVSGCKHTVQEAILDPTITGLTPRNIPNSRTRGVIFKSVHF